MLTVATAALWADDLRIARAADHFDPPARTDPLVNSTPDAAADIADVYVWHTTDSLVIAVTFAGPQVNTLPAIYDRDVLYTINISNAGSPTDPEIQIRWRFGKDGTNAGVQVTGLPDGGPPLEGPVEQTLTRGAIQVRAGLYDDPFFFDLQGFRETRSTGTLSFRSDRNFFAGQNDTANVVVPDTIKVDLTRPAGFPNGRRLTDSVIDLELAYLFLDVAKQGVNVLTNLPLGPQANDVPFRANFPYLAPPQGNPPGLTPGGTNFNFRTDAPSAYVQVDRMGNPAVATAVIGSSAKTAYNDDSPAIDGTLKYVPEIGNTLTALTNALADDFTRLGLTLCAKGA